MVFAFWNKLVFTFDLLPDVALGALNPQHFLLHVKHPFKLQTATRSFRCCGEHSHNYSSAWSERGSRERERERERERGICVSPSKGTTVTYMPFTCTTQTGNDRQGHPALEDVQPLLEWNNYCWILGKRTEDK
jgi:hypothetical protein